MIKEDLGGNGNGLSKVFGTPQFATRWAWKRLANSGVRSGSLEIVKMSFCNILQQSTSSDATRAFEGSVNIQEHAGSDFDDATDLITPSEELSSGPITAPESITWTKQQSE